MVKKTPPKLKIYREKRDFGRTPEPRGERAKRVKSAARFPGNMYVIQKHAATRLHYDLRLAVGGVLKSWAVPKGPPLDPAQKRLAVMTEDHPMEYASFEGVIPEKQYGAGEVIVWDAGYYENTTEKRGRALDPAEAIAHGHFSFRLEGKKLRGGFSLSRMADGKNWLLFKKRDEFAEPSRDITADSPSSILTGRTIEDLKSF